MMTLLLAALAIATVPTAAQDNEVSVQFISFPRAANPGTVELAIGEGRTIEVELPTNSFSPVYQVPRLVEWVLGERVEAADDEPSFHVFGRAPGVASANQLVLVIRQGANDRDGLNLVAMDNSQAGFGGGRYLVMNATRVDIGGRIGTGEFALRPQQHRLLAPGPTSSNDGRDYAFARFYYRGTDGAQPFFSATWRFNERARSVVFFYHDPSTTQLRVHTIRSFPD